MGLGTIIATVVIFIAIVGVLPGPSGPLGAPPTNRQLAGFYAFALVAALFGAALLTELA